MIKIEKVEVCGFESAIRGMRNPLNSWDKSDSGFDQDSQYIIGPNDLRLMNNLARLGNDHGKFARMITVTVDITAPLYWWKEFDTYKVGTVANSCSTMHTIHTKEFELDDFSHEHLFSDWEYALPTNPIRAVIDYLNFHRKLYVETKQKQYWWQLIQMLPSSYNQKRTVMLNYQVLWSMYQARCKHKLDEWLDFCAWIETLPYFKNIYTGEDIK